MLVNMPLKECVSDNIDYQDIEVENQDTNKIWYKILISNAYYKI